MVVQPKAAQVIQEPGLAIKPVIQKTGDAVQKELDKASPSSTLLDSYSKLYTSLGAIAATYSTSTTSFSLKRSEWAIIGVWFVGLIVTALLAVKAFGLTGADVATVIASWTAVLLGLIGVSALSSAKSKSTGASTQ
jgi:hypothetical protein